MVILPGGLLPLFINFKVVQRDDLEVLAMGSGLVLL